jgi:hypothetical protein
VSRIFGPIDQVCWLVPDLDAAMLHFSESLGIGPWFASPPLKPTDFNFEGERSPIEMSLALTYSGRLQIELVQQHNDAPSMYKESIDAGQYGQHHVGFFRRRYDEELEKARAAGYEVGQNGSLGGSLRFAYLRTAATPGTTAELIELTDPVEAAFVSIHGATHDWDGSDPIRRMAGF